MNNVREAQHAFVYFCFNLVRVVTESKFFTTFACCRLHSVPNVIRRVMEDTGVQLRKSCSGLSVLEKRHFTDLGSCDCNLYTVACNLLNGTHVAATHQFSTFQAHFEDASFEQNRKDACSGETDKL